VEVASIPSFWALFGWMRDMKTFSFSPTVRKTQTEILLSGLGYSEVNGSLLVQDNQKVVHEFFTQT